MLLLKEQKNNNTCLIYACVCRFLQRGGGGDDCKIKMRTTTQLFVALLTTTIGSLVDAVYQCPLFGYSAYGFGFAYGGN